MPILSFISTELYCHYKFGHWDLYFKAQRYGWDSYANWRKFWNVDFFHGLTSLNDRSGGLGRGLFITTFSAIAPYIIIPFLLMLFSLEIIFIGKYLLPNLAPC
ncbi:MAG: hypothetical protein WCG27_01915 [Pseudomonadota bacterium]